MRFKRIPCQKSFNEQLSANCSQFSIFQKRDVIVELSKAKGTRGKNKCLHSRYPPCLGWTINSHLYSNFEWSVESKSELLWFCFVSFGDWSGRLPLLPQPIRFKTKTNRDMVTRVFPRFRQFASFHLEFSLALKVFTVF